MSEKVSVMPTPVDGAGAKITISVKDRLVVRGLMPEAGKMLEMTVAQDIIKKFQVGQEEAKEIELRIDGNRFTWNPDKATDIEIHLSGTEIDFLQSRVSQLDQAGKITLEVLDLAKLLKRL